MRTEPGFHNPAQGSGYIYNMVKCFIIYTVQGFTLNYGKDFFSVKIGNNSAEKIIFKGSRLRTSEII